MIRDPLGRGRHLASLFLELAPRLFRDVEESGLLQLAAEGDARRARDEWNGFAMYACVRGLVAAGGFNRETGEAIDAFHQAVLAAWDAEEENPERRRRLRALVSERYAEYGAIGQEGGAAGARTSATRLGRRAAAHVSGTQAPGETLIEIVAALHESLVEGASAAVRDAS